MTSGMLKQSVMLKSSNPASIHAICDCITNIIHQKIHVTARQKRDLAKKKNVLRTLSSSRTQTSRKKELLIQHGGGILKTILGTVVNAITLL